MPFWDTDYKKEMMKSKAAKEAAEERAAEAKQRAAEYRQKVNAVIVTTGDLKEDYEIIGPVYFQVSNKGLFSSTLSDLVNKYSAEIEEKVKHAAASSVGGGGGLSAPSDDRDAYFAEAGKFIIEKEKGSIGMLQRMFKVGFNRAARIMDQLEDAGVVGPEEGTKPRKVLMSMEEFEQYVDEYV